MGIARRDHGKRMERKVAASIARQRGREQARDQRLRSADREF
jgi:hypothetical protein